MITCLSLDVDGHHLITGSRDSTCRLWGIAHQGGVAQELIRTPLQTLYGHDKEITCAAMSWELDMAVSGSQVGFRKYFMYHAEQFRTFSLKRNAPRISKRGGVGGGGEEKRGHLTKKT